MNPISRSFAAVLLAVSLASPASAALPTSGKVLVLDNGQVIEGQADCVGDRYRVVKDGGETWLPASRVRAVCPDLTAAYQALSAAIGATDANARLRLARWCESVGLRDQALTETRSALAIKPGHAEAQRYRKHLEAAPIVRASATVPAAPRPTAPEPPPVEVGAEALKRFTTKVQSVLMNTCVNCHATGTAGAFHLQRVVGGPGNQAATRFNLAAAASQIDRANPSSSKLLSLAVTAHGGAPVPPLRDKSAAPFKLLEEWVSLVAAERRPTPGKSETPAPIVPIEDKPTPPAPITDTTSNKSEPPKDPADPFDPGAFNRQHHPTPPTPPKP